MPEKLAVITASLGSYEGEDGKKHSRPRDVGYLMQHSDGRCYLMMDATFDYGRIPIPPGANAFFLNVRVRDGLKINMAARS